MADPWQDDAACATEAFRERAYLAGATRDPSQVFYPVLEDDEGNEIAPEKRHLKKYARYRLRESRFERLARETCAACPVRKECLFTNMTLENEAHGIVGGLDASNRIALLSDDNPRLEARECQCGITIHGAVGATPEFCSANCRGER